MAYAIWLVGNGAAGRHGSVVLNPPIVNGAGHAPAASATPAADTAPGAGKVASSSSAYPAAVQGNAIPAHAPVMTASVNQTPVANSHGAAIDAAHPVQVNPLANIAGTIVGRSDAPVSAPAIASAPAHVPAVAATVAAYASGTQVPAPVAASLTPGSATTGSVTNTILNGAAGIVPAAAVKTVAASAPAAAPAAFYVAANGNDAWSGRLAAPNAAGTDGPLATLQAAQAHMRASTTIKTTYVEGGTYNLHATLALTAADSGESWLGYAGQTAVINGGQTVTGWTQGSGGVWTAQAPAGAFALGGGIADLFVGGVRQSHARYPNAVPTNPVQGGWLPVQASLAGEKTSTSFQFKPGDLPVLASAQGLYAVVYEQNGWESYTLPVASINYKTDTITLAGATDMPIGVGSHFYLYNAASLLNAAGEWFYNPASGSISLDAPAGFTGQGVTVGSLANIVSISDTSNVTVSGLTLTGSASSGNGVLVDGSSGVTLDGDTIDNVGDGIMFSANGGNDRVEGNVIENTGNDGILINPGTSGVTITGNSIHDIGQMLNGSAIWFTGSSNDVITHNLIQQVARYGVGGGSTIGASDASYNDVISYNQVANTNLATSDGGGIYLGGMQQTSTGDTISYNEIYGTSAAGTAATAQLQFLPATQLSSYAIYLDDFASGVTVHGNLLTNNVGGIQVHSGSNDVFSDNILANDSGIAILDQVANWRGTAAQAPSGNLFTGNLIADSQPGAVLAENQGDPTNAQWTKNFYSQTGLSAQAFVSDTVAGVYKAQALAGWQASGYDAGSLSGNPGLTSSNGVYALAANSAAHAVGVTGPTTGEFGLSGFVAGNAYDLFGH